MDGKKKGFKLFDDTKKAVLYVIDAQKNNPKSRKRLSLLGIGIFIVFLPIIIFYTLIVYGVFGPFPDRAELRDIRTEVASEVFSSDNTILGKYYIKNRSQASISKIPKHVIEALIATEDARFYEHGGIDIKSLFRVLFKSIVLQDQHSGGGSTLSQQLAKNLYPRTDLGNFTLPVNKFKEMLIAKRLERMYTKEEILSMYMNTVSFGENVFGIEAASQRFFGKKTSELLIEEAATLVGMLKATTLYNPRLNPERSKTRRNTVLAQMKKYSYIKSEQFEILKDRPLTLSYTYRDHNTGLAPYFREYLRQELNDWCKTHTKKGGGKYNIYTDGLKIYTTIDSRIQSHAEAAVAEEMKKLQKNFDRLRPNFNKISKDPMIQQAIKRTERYRLLKKQGLSEEEIATNFQAPVMMTIFSWDGPVDREMSPLDSIIYYQYFLHAGFLAISPTSGEVLAWVGGIDHRYFKYDHVRSRRQVGSTFKPILYAGAIESGLSPCDYISNDKVEFAKFDNWTPRNSDDMYGGEYSMEGGLTHSVNVVAVNLILKAGIKRVIKTAKRLGINGELPAVPSLALGAADLSLIEMVSAYSSLTNGGLAVTPHFLQRIEDKHGNVLYELEDISPRRVISSETAEMMTHMLKSVVNTGTGAGLRSRYRIRSDIAGKTGTTQDQADGWFIGCTPDIVAGSWVGAEDRRVHFNTLSQGQGARTAMPLWASFYKKLMKDTHYEDWKYSTFPAISYASRSKLDCEHFQQIMSMSEFREWWAQQQQYTVPTYRNTQPYTNSSPNQSPSTYRRNSIISPRINQSRVP